MHESIAGNGGWSFSNWSECSATCGLSGVRTRTATTCDNPTPLLGGEDCNESDGVEIGACNRMACQGINVRLARVY